MRANLEAFLPRTSTEERRTFLLAFMAREAGDVPLSTQLYDELAEKTPRSPLLWYFGSLAYGDDQQDNKAANYLRLGNERLQDSYSSFPARRARWLNTRRQWRSATRHIKKALSTSPGRAQLQIALARQYGKKGWHEEELRILTRVAREHPGFAAGYQALGDCLRSHSVFLAIPILQCRGVAPPDVGDA